MEVPVGNDHEAPLRITVARTIQNMHLHFLLFRFGPLHFLCDLIGNFSLGDWLMANDRLFES